MSGTEFEYWDSCVFLAYLQREVHRPGEMEYINAQAEKFDIGAVGIVTSAIALTEVYESRLTPEQTSQLRSMYSRSNFQFIDATADVCRLSSEIRGYYRANYTNAAGESLYPSTPDAIHVASALAARAGLKQASPLKLITFDSRDKPKEKCMAMTNMSANGLVANKYPLIICRPPVAKNEQIDLIAAK